jgi:predicted dehydrogenase
MRLAVLGLGVMGATHLKALRDVPGAEIVALYSSDEKKLDGDLSSLPGNPQGLIDFSGARKYRELDRAISDSAAEAVDICLPTFLHDAVAVEALRAGKHVLVEKPMALDGFGADRMANAARRYKRVLMTAHVLRFSPEYVSLREAVLDNQLGQVQFAVFQRWCAAPTRGEWWRNADKSGGGVFDLLIHDVDFCLHLFGKPKAVSASGHCDLERGMDFLNAQLYYEHGGVVVVTGGWLDAPGFASSAEYRVAMEGGTLEYRSAGCPPTLYASGSGGRPLGLGSGGADGYRSELQYFAVCCRTGTAPELCPPNESVDAVKLMRLLLEARSRAGAKLVCRV